MPILREWMVNYPSYWTPAQAHAYAKHVAMELRVFFGNVANAIGPVNAINILLSVITDGARANPVYINDVQGSMARAFDLLNQIRGVTEGTKH